MTAPGTEPTTGPGTEATAGPSDETPTGPDDNPATGSEAATIAHRRTHPITPLVTGWKIVVGIVAVLTAQNIARLAGDFTWGRALAALGILVVAVVIAVAASALSWWFTTYAVDESGVALHKGLLSKSREFAPREKIESVTVERPFLARLLGLSKVRVEVAGGGESYLDIEYVRAADAEELRTRILAVAAGVDPRQVDAASTPTAPGDLTDADQEPSADSAPPASAPPASAPDPLRKLLKGEVEDGELIAEIPTQRLVQSLVRDADFLLSIVFGIIGGIVAIGLGIWQDGFAFASLIALLPALIALPKYVFGRIEGGWGFVSRITDRGLRMRRGLLNTRTDNIATGRIQRFALKRPLLWRSPGWTSVSVTVAGIGDDSNEASSVLPVGTREELWLTLGHLAPTLGTADDMATLEHLLTAPARDIDGLRAPHRLQWYSRRTQVVVLLPGALIQRQGLLARTLVIIPRDRIQQVAIEDDPFARRLRSLDLKVGVAGHTETIGDLPRDGARMLHAVLAHDAATSRRYSDRSTWREPALALSASAGTGQETGR
ncbi:PH domain-containing protein [Brachybacterium epidermidis]|uniref:PH domain-containing protein n=1 Tax=Brachybacterium epidermidis TaxID=2781983 RepID=UPI00398F2EA0